MRSKPMILAALLLTAFLVNLDTLVNMALPAMVRPVHVTTTQLQWVVGLQSRFRRAADLRQPVRPVRPQGHAATPVPGFLDPDLTCLAAMAVACLAFSAAGSAARRCGSRRATMAP